MPKHHRVWNKSVYDIYMRKGRGRGSGSSYVPWIYIQDFASRGVVSRVKGRTTGRVHHLMSNYELAYFYVLEWSDAVIDIREQYPLSDLEYAVSIASKAGIKYPADQISGYPYVLTCDFMVTTKEGLKARTIKMTTELSKKRTLEKLEIERRYWLAKRIDWKIVTEHEIPLQKAKNIEWLYTAQDCCVQIHNSARVQNVLRQLLLNGKYSIIEAAQMIEEKYMLVAGMGIQLFKQLVLSGAIIVNLDEPLNLNERGVITVA